MDIDVTEPRPADSAILRRRLLGLGVGGAAASLLPFLGGRASATTPPDSTANSTAGTTAGSAATPAAGSTAGSTAATTTTSAPPKRPTDDDVTLLGFAQSIELAARDLYDVALGIKGLDATQKAVISVIRESHEAYATSLSGLLGRKAPQQTSSIAQDLKSSFGGDVPSMLDAAYKLESTAVATHIDALGKLRGTDAAGLIASILIVEGRHGTVLAYLNGKTTLDELLVDDEADPLSADAVKP